MPVMPVIIRELCNGCNLCVQVCCCGALQMIDGVITVVETEECGYCVECEAVCPTGAIRCPYEIMVVKYHEHSEIVSEERREES